MESIDEFACKQKQNESPYRVSELTPPCQAMPTLDEHRDNVKKEHTLSRRRMLLAVLLVVGWLCSKVAFQWRFGAQRTSPFSAQLDAPVKSQAAGGDFFDWDLVSSMFLPAL